MSSSIQSSPSQVRLVMSDAAALNRAAMEEFVRSANHAITDHDRFAVALSGGNTPRSVYSLIADNYQTSLPWNKVHIFFGDERSVPPDNPESNYRMARESLLSKVPIPDSNVHRVRAELPADQAAQLYSAELADFFHLEKQNWPRFDLIMLGIGDEGHTASLFPDSKALTEKSQLVVANWVEKFHTWRITFTYPVLNHAAEVMFLVSGAGKAAILKAIFDPAQNNVYPAQGVHPETGKLLWMVDAPAASLL